MSKEKLPLTETEQQAVDQASKIFSSIVMAGGSVIIFVLVFGGLVAVAGGMWQLIKFAWGV